MRYSKEFIDEVVASYCRVLNKSFISRTYGVEYRTVDAWVKKYYASIANVNKAKYAEHLAYLYSVMKYYNEVNDYDLVAKKFDINPKEIQSVLANYEVELRIKKPNFLEIEKQLIKLKKDYAKIYERVGGPLVLEKLLIIEIYLGMDNDYLSKKYNANITALDVLRQTYVI